MYHYDAASALEELSSEAVLPSPVHVRDMLIRSALSPEEALDMNRRFQEYLRAFGNAQEIARQILTRLSEPGRKA